MAEEQKEEVFEKKIGGEISLIGFNALPLMELIVVKKIIGNHVKELSEKTDYKTLKLQLRIHQKGESSLNEITAQATIGNDNIGAKVENWNLYEAIGKIMETIMAEALKKRRTPKEMGGEIFREQKKKERKEEQL